MNLQTIKNRQLELVDVLSNFAKLVPISKCERIQLNPALVSLVLLLLFSASFLFNTRLNLL